ncbi:MAG: hypothetical protein M3Y69_09085, partial [Verrucomicrobiota bacterium]|nr:hypothetical protein [Verrucomicrobiota bacterium]
LVSDPLLREDIQQCVAGDPQKRFAAAAQLAERLRSLPERRDVQARDQSRINALEHRAYRRGILRTAAVAVAIVAALASLWIYALGQSQKARHLLQEASVSDVATAKNLFGKGNWREAVAYLGRALYYDSENRLASSWLWSEMVYGEGDRDRLPRLLLRHDARVNSAVFSPDGRRIVTTCGELREPGYAQQWDAITGEPIGPRLQHLYTVLSATYSADGHRIVTACGNELPEVGDKSQQWGYAQQWEASTGEAIGEPLRASSALKSAAYSADQQLILTRGDFEAQLWTVADSKRIGGHSLTEKRPSKVQFSAPIVHSY